MCFARTRIWACIAKRDLVIWCFEEYLWFVFKVLLKNSYGAFRLDPIELSEIWWFDALKSTFDLSSKCCWRTLMGRLGLIQQTFVLCRLQALMKEAWELFERASLLEELVLKKICIFQDFNPFLGFFRLRSSIYRDL